MEFYNSALTNRNNPQQTCGAAVQAFLSAWVATVQANSFKAGVYGSVPEINADYIRVNPTPDDIWVTYVPNLSHDTVTVWNLASGGQSLKDAPTGAMDRDLPNTRLTR
jgi:hypothetical protein